MKTKTERAPKNAAGPGMCQLAGQALDELLRRVTPPGEAQAHFQTARIEFLKGLRSLIDSRIEQISKAGAKGQKIRVD